MGLFVVILFDMCFMSMERLFLIKTKSFKRALCPKFEWSYLLFGCWLNVLDATVQTVVET